MQQRTETGLYTKEIISMTDESCAKFTDPACIKVQQQGQENIALKDMPPEERLGQASLNIYRAIRLLKNNKGGNANIEQELNKLGFEPLYKDCKRCCCCLWFMNKKKEIIGFASSDYANNPQGNMVKITKNKGEKSYLLIKKHNHTQGLDLEITPIEDMPTKYMIRLDDLKKFYPEDQELQKINTAQEFIDIMLSSAPKQKELEETDIWLAKSENAANNILSMTEEGCPDKATIRQAKELLETENKLIKRKTTSEKIYYPGKNKGSNKYYSLLEAYQSA